MVKIQNDGKGRYFITVPKQYIRSFGWKTHQELMVYPSGQKHELIIREMPKGK